MTTYCVSCDSDRIDCSHDGLRYLEPIMYERVSEGFKVPDHERERWESDKWTSDKIHTAAPTPQPRLLRELIAELEPYVFLSQDIRTLMHDAYDISPIQVTLVVTHLVQQAGNLDSPTGLLKSRLRQMVVSDDIPIP